MNEDEICNNCRFYFTDKIGKIMHLSHCRRHSPVVVEMNGHVYTRFPEVLSSDCCGDFEPKEK